MMTPSLLHHTFRLERNYPRPPAEVFAAWRDPVAKKEWFAGGGEHELDFRVGGTETTGTTVDGKRISFQARYVDIVEGARIVFVATLSTDDVLSTTSITSVELRPDGAGTALVLTESDVFLDGLELPQWREHGTGDWLDALGRSLA